jgi:SAM-dependent methyltransferase
MDTLQLHTSPSLALTGERMVPAGSDAQTFWEHTERYRFAARFVPGLDVLDIACGEGYGSAALLKAGAKSVVGVDIAPEAVAHAKRRYQVDARVGSALAIPLEDGSVDLVVSFETIEHLEKPEQFLRECARVLRPGGRILLSTPNASTSEHGNPFHLSEMTVAELTQLMANWFAAPAFYAQRPSRAFYFRWRGLRRVTEWARRWVAPDMAGAMTPDLRARVVDLCLRERPAVLRWLFPEVVRPAKKIATRPCVFMLVLARLRECE